MFGKLFKDSAVPRPPPGLELEVLSLQSHDPAMVIDTACQANILGKAWGDSHEMFIEGKALNMLRTPFVKTFRFGDGEPE